METPFCPKWKYQISDAQMLTIAEEKQKYIDRLVSQALKEGTYNSYILVKFIRSFVNY